MDPIVKNQKQLRRGWTTGSCAAAATAAAAQLLLTGAAPSEVSLMTPAGIQLRLDVERAERTDDTATCAVRKDAGDDPDVTDGILIYAQVSKRAEGIVIDGGAGVGRVTKPGLACAVGEAAINPAPRAQIEAAARKTALALGYSGGFSICILAEQGEKIAEKTMNARLGIVGGISILGTSGLVEPMSERALVETIHLEVDSRLAAGQTRLLACPGNYGRTFAETRLGLDMSQAVIISNFIGDFLDYAVYKGVPQILLIGHAGKLVKLAAGVMQTHSSYADARQEVFAAHAALQGAPVSVIAQLMDSVTVDACLATLEQTGLAQSVMQSIGTRILEHLTARTRGKIQTEVIVFTNERGILWQSADAQTLLSFFQEKTS